MSDRNASIAELAAVSAAFPLHGKFVTGALYGSGHINDTFAVTFDQAGTAVRYILQRVNHRIFKNVPALMDNIQRVTAHTARRTAAGEDGARRALTLLPARTGEPYHRDAAGAYWRCYLFIEKAATYDLVRDAHQASEAAAAVGQFQHLLVDLPGERLRETIPHFHDTPRRFATLRAAVERNPHGRATAAAAEIEFALAREPIVGRLLALHAAGQMPERITHNDTKFNNVMLDDATGRALCVIDLDTVMPGLALYDFGDMVRSATNSTAEDDPEPRNVRMRMEIFEGLVSGYLSAAGAFLNPTERAHLAFSGRLITFEIGIRFLTDFLEGDVYFKTKHPHHNLDRCRNQFALVRSIEEQEAAMQTVVDKMRSGR